MDELTQRSLRDRIKDLESLGQSQVVLEASSRQALDPHDGESSQSLAEIQAELGDCQRCGLSQERTNIVFGIGHKNADLVIVGEAPGRDEDRQGEPFVGRAGKLLTDILAAIGLNREDVYICNVIKCRPPQNRNPEPEEVNACSPFLLKQIQAIRPSVVLCVGKFASQTLLASDTPISKLRGEFHDFHGMPLMATYHPAYLLRNPSAKRVVWEDVLKVHEKLETLTGKTFVLKSAGK